MVGWCINNREPRFPVTHTVAKQIEGKTPLTRNACCPGEHESPLIRSPYSRSPAYKISHLWVCGDQRGFILCLAWNHRLSPPLQHNENAFLENT